MPTALELIDAATVRLQSAELYYGHGTDNAADDALFLVLHGLGLDYDCREERLHQQCAASDIAAVDALIAQRIERRLPSAYLTQRMWFAGLAFFVDERVLVPRSPLAELIRQRFSPWADALEIKRILEIGTGSGCIAIALAKYFPQANIVATDISPQALAVARENLRKHLELADRITLAEADLFPSGEAAFDLIVTNPPYVPVSTMADLPAEYHAEPAIALAAGEDGLDFIDEILATAASKLNPSGLLFFDVGDRWRLLDERYPELPFLWCELEHGGEGIGMLERKHLSTINRTQVK